jgi:hypothetical protein
VRGVLDGGARDVRCPGTAAAVPAGFDARCPTPLPRKLLGPLYPRRRPWRVVARAIMAEAVPFAAPPDTLRGALHDFRASFYEAWSGAARVQHCPWCSVPHVLVDGCDFVTCAVCHRAWCFACRCRLEPAGHFEHTCKAMTNKIARLAALVSELLLIILFSQLLLRLIIWAGRAYARAPPHD